MSDEVLRKVTFETELLALVVTSSLTLSMFLIADATIGLIVEHYGLTLTALRVFELVFAVTWLVFSVSMFREINWLRKTRYRIFFLRKSEELDEEQKKSETTELIMNIIGFYRDNYLKFAVVVTLAIGVSLLIVMTVTFLLFTGSMSLWVAVFRWAVNSFMLMIASVLYVYIHRSWRRKLLKVKEAEKKFLEMLGGPVEA
jgi:membrane protein implicated in regulation of membrane protease activity